MSFETIARIYYAIQSDFATLFSLALRKLRIDTECGLRLELVILTEFKDLVIDQNFEFASGKGLITLPHPLIRLKVFELYAFLPVESWKTFASQKEGVGKTGIELHNHSSKGFFLLLEFKHLVHSLNNDLKIVNQGTC